MSVQDIAPLGKMLVQFLALFADCFCGSRGQRLLAVYVRGLLSDIGRKNVETIALKQNVAPRTLQRFLETINWDHEGALRQCRRIIAAEHPDPEAIGVIDETGTTKSGSHTVGVKRQYNGNRGKIEAWRVDYNEHRPHSALGNLAPKDFASSGRARPAR
tara:strand:- start:916 stop:1392 length:477 start_codon:yes stop_codon:yes gene_type:complete